MDNTINKQVYDYFNAVNENHGHIYHHRREYEESLDAVNKTVSSYLDSEKEKIQHVYPSYFEKYRTDTLRSSSNAVTSKVKIAVIFTLIFTQGFSFKIYPMPTCVSISF